MAIKKFTVSRDENIYEAWPDVTLVNDKKLIAVFTECEHHLDRNNSRIVLVESNDRGETWSEKRALTEKSKDAVDFFNNARIGKFPDGSLYVLCDKIHNVEKRSSVLHLWRSYDEGKTWSEPTTLPLNGIVPDKITFLKSGRMIVSAHLNGKNGFLEQYMIYSDDEGKTWSDQITVAAKDGLNLCEVSMLEYNGAIVAFLRENSRKGHDILKVISYDEGLTWSEIYSTPLDCGHRPVSGFLRDGRVMLTYRYIPTATQNTFAAFQPPEALLETDRAKCRVRIMPLDYDRNPAPDTGYTGWVQFDDGEIYVVNYIKDDSDKGQIRGYKFSLDDIELPVTDTATKNVF